MLISLNERFWSKVQIKDIDTCWNWTYSTFEDGYGKFKMNVDNKWKSRRAHRVAYELEHNINLTEDLQVLHSCDNRVCCNPAHLRIGTHTDNMNDVKDRGRARNGKELWTHCKHHPDEELSSYPSGYRYCKICKSKRDLEWYNRNRELISAKRKKNYALTGKQSGGVLKANYLFQGR